MPQRPSATEAPLLPLLLTLALPVLGGCGVLGELILEDGITTEHSTANSDVNGVVTVQLDVADNADSFLLTAEAGALLAVESVQDPDGEEVFYWEDWYGISESLTYAVYPEAQDMVFNWPVRESDAGLRGGVWTVYLGAYEASGGYYTPVSGVTTDLTVQQKVDADLGRGELAVQIVYAEGVADDPAVVAATEAAVERWEEVWAPYDIFLAVSYVEDGGVSADMAFPGEDAVLDEASALSDDEDVTVVIGETIDGGLDYYGVAGSVPGALVRTERSGVVVSWLANAGGDGDFSDDDIRLYGETLAHEVGHYVGLFHPVETTWDMWDALGDTEDCGTQNACEADLGDNNMFPYPICSWTSCTPQDLLSDDQIGVTQRYTGLL